MDVAGLLRLQSRGEIKRWGAWLDGEGSVHRPALLRLAVEQGAGLEEIAHLDGRRLLRLCLDRAVRAQVRQNPIHRDEGFLCVRCGASVPPGGRRPRDHCPYCLTGLHVDGSVPGDRAATCGGRLVPVAVEPKEGSLDLLYRCDACGATRRNRVLDDVPVPDDLAAVRALVAGTG